MTPVTLSFLTEQLVVAEQLRTGREMMFEPQDLPGRYGRVIRSIDGLLQVLQCESVLGGGWAVWRHGFLGRVTQDVDIVLAADRVEEFLRVAAVSGFESLPQRAGRWPKVRHKETGVQVHILPEGARPGTAARLAPTTIPHPSRLGAAGPRLRYINLPALIELKLAAGRGRDESDVIELVRANPDEVEGVRRHLAAVHAAYASAFDRLVERAREQEDH
jgi:hypothetical protein